MKPLEFSPENMGLVGWQRYCEYLDTHQADPIIKTPADLVYYGFISKERAVEMISEEIRLKKRKDIIVGAICLPIFLVWLAFSCHVYRIWPEPYVLLHGPVFGAVGALFSVLSLRRGLKKATHSH